MSSCIFSHQASAWRRNLAVIRSTHKFVSLTFVLQSNKFLLVLRAQNIIMFNLIVKFIYKIICSISSFLFSISLFISQSICWAPLFYISLTIHNIYYATKVYKCIEAETCPLSYLYTSQRPDNPYLFHHHYYLWQNSYTPGKRRSSDRRHNLAVSRKAKKAAPHKAVFTACWHSYPRTA